jgi:hypothetical protein
VRLDPNTLYDGGFVLKKTLGLALIGVLALSLAGVAYAQSVSNTTMDLSFSAKPGKSGTKKKPKAVKLKLGIEQATKDGTGQPATSTSLKITLPKGLNWNGKSWAKSKRCSLTKVNQAQSDSVCPKGSKVGTGQTIAEALGTVETLDVTAYVTTSASLGLFLKGAPLPIAEMIEGKVKGRVINVKIPTNIQEPVAGVRSAITTLKFGLTGKTKAKGKSRGIIESTACSGKKWTLKFENIMDGGKLTDTKSVACKK